MSKSTTSRITLAGLRREIKKINRRLRRITSKRGKLWERLSVDKTSFLNTLWTRCPHEEAIVGKYTLAPFPNGASMISIDLGICRDCGVDVHIHPLQGLYGVLASARRLRLTEGQFLLETLEIFRRNGINL